MTLRHARHAVQSCQSKDMDEKIKSYRQAIFKLDHAERKRGEAPASKEQSMFDSCFWYLFLTCSVIALLLMWQPLTFSVTTHMISAAAADAM